MEEQKNLESEVKEAPAPIDTVRDDLYEFAWFLDTVRLTRKQRRRFRLIDSGRFDRFQLEWLLGAGADLYTSDEARPDFQEIEQFQIMAKRGKGLIVFFQHGDLADDAEMDTAEVTGLINLGQCGVYIHISNREFPRDFHLLEQLGEACHTGGSRLIYYHHDLLPSEIEEVARKDAWIHLADKSIPEKEQQELLKEILGSSAYRAKFVVYVEKGLDAIICKELIEAGAYVFFQKKQYDYRSPFRPLEKAASRRRLDFKAYYLYPTFLP